MKMYSLSTHPHDDGNSGDIVCCPQNISGGSQQNGVAAFV